MRVIFQACLNSPVTFFFITVVLIYTLANEKATILRPDYISSINKEEPKILEYFSDDLLEYVGTEITVFSS